MAEQTTAAKKKATSAAKPKARKTPAKRKPAAKKPKSVVRSNVRSIENKAAAVERKVRRTARKAEDQFEAVEEATEEFSGRVQDVAHNAILATLGFYAMAFDQAQDQLDSLQARLEERREKALTTYADMVKRGKTVESKARTAVDDLDLSIPRDRKALEAKLSKARQRFEELKDSAVSKIAA